MAGAVNGAVGEEVDSQLGTFLCGVSIKTVVEEGEGLGGPVGRSLDVELAVAEVSVGLADFHHALSIGCVAFRLPEFPLRVFRAGHEARARCGPAAAGVDQGDAVVARPGGEADAAQRADIEHLVGEHAAVADELEAVDTGLGGDDVVYLPLLPAIGRRGIESHGERTGLLGVAFGHLRELGRLVVHFERRGMEQGGAQGHFLQVAGLEGEMEGVGGVRGIFAAPLEGGLGPFAEADVVLQASALLSRHALAFAGKLEEEAVVCLRPVAGGVEAVALRHEVFVEAEADGAFPGFGKEGEEHLEMGIVGQQAILNPLGLLCAQAVQAQEEEGIGAAGRFVDGEQAGVGLPHFFAREEAALEGFEGEHVEQVVAEVAAVGLGREEGKVGAEGTMHEGVGALEGGPEEGPGALAVVAVAEAAAGLVGLGERGLPEGTPVSAPLGAEALFHAFEADFGRVGGQFAAVGVAHEGGAEELHIVVLREGFPDDFLCTLEGGLGLVGLDGCDRLLPEVVEGLRGSVPDARAEEKEEEYFLHNNVFSIPEGVPGGSGPALRGGAAFPAVPDAAVVTGIAQDAEQHDEGGFQSVADEGKGLGHAGQGTVDAREGLGDGEMPRPSSGGCGEEHAHTGGGEHVEHVGEAHVGEGFETGQEEVELEEVAQPDARTEADETEGAAQAGYGADALPEVLKEAAYVGPERKTDADEQAHEAADDGVEAVVRHDPRESFGEALHEAHGLAPAQGDGHADEHHEAGYVGELFDHHGAEGAGGGLGIAAPHEERAGEFAEPRRHAID